MRQRDRDYHVERARAELDLAQEAESQAAALAHARLSSLHLEQARQVNGRSDGIGSDSPEAH